MQTTHQADALGGLCELRVGIRITAAAGKYQGFVHITLENEMPEARHRFKFSEHITVRISFPASSE